MSETNQTSRPGSFIRELGKSAVEVAEATHDGAQSVADAYSLDNLKSIGELARNIVKGLRSKPESPS